MISLIRREVPLHSHAFATFPSLSRVMPCTAFRSQLIIIVSVFFFFFPFQVSQFVLELRLKLKIITIIIFIMVSFVTLSLNTIKSIFV